MILLTAGCMIASAQTNSSTIDDVLEKAAESRTISKPSSPVKFEFFSHVRFGHIIAPGEFYSKKFLSNNELEVNTFEIGLYPTDWLGIRAGLDLKFDTFNTIPDRYVFDLDNNRQPNIYSIIIPKEYSRLDNFALGIPAVLQFRSGKVRFKLGGEALFYLSSNVRTAYKSTTNDIVRRVIDTADGGRPSSFVWTWLAELNLSGLGIYYRYCPNPAIPGGNTNLVYHTIGISFGR